VDLETVRGSSISDAGIELLVASGYVSADVACRHWHSVIGTPSFKYLSHQWSESERQVSNPSQHPKIQVTDGQDRQRSKSLVLWITSLSSPTVNMLVDWTHGDRLSTCHEAS
jgi:hypothetical protein